MNARLTEASRAASNASRISLVQYSSCPAVITSRWARKLEGSRCVSRFVWYETSYPSRSRNRTSCSSYQNGDCASDPYGRSKETRYDRDRGGLSLSYRLLPPQALYASHV